MALHIIDLYTNLTMMALNVTSSYLSLVECNQY